MKYSTTIGLKRILNKVGEFPEFGHAPNWRVWLVPISANVFEVFRYPVMQMPAIFDPDIANAIDATYSLEKTLQKLPHQGEIIEV